MIIPIAIDLSEHDSIPEYKHDSADFVQLSRNLTTHPFLLIHNGTGIEQSHFYRMISALPQKSRDALIRICKKIPRRAIADWDGNIEQTIQPSLNESARIVALSKAKFHIHFEYDEDEYVAPHPAHPELECALWKAIEHTQSFTQMQQLVHAPIRERSLRSTLWNERFAPVIAADKWIRIKLVDRYIFLDQGLDFTAIDFLLRKLNAQLQYDTEIEIFVQTNKYRGYDRDTGTSIDHFPEITQHLQQTIASCERIAAIRIYAFHSSIGRIKLHARFMYLHSARELLYAYNLDGGFKIFRSEYIHEDSIFDCKIHHIPSDVETYKTLDVIKPTAQTRPDYRDTKVSVYVVS